MKLHPKCKDLTGLRFSRLTVLSYAGSGRWACRCDCGQPSVVIGGNLRSSQTRSCGCLRRETARKYRGEKNPSYKHGKSGSPEYRSWGCLVQRTTNPKNNQYQYYGGRGISVSASYTGPDGAKTFLQDMGPKPGPSHSIDRIDNDKGYTEKNLRWATSKQQRANRGDSKKRKRNESD